MNLNNLYVHDVYAESLFKQNKTDAVKHGAAKAVEQPQSIGLAQRILQSIVGVNDEGSLLELTEDTPSMAEVRRKYEGTDQWMKAPNGEQTRLDERQWLQVRTPEFKQWFGDWEDDPEHASKIVDGNGEPMVVYHGTGERFEVFDRSLIGENTSNDLSDPAVRESLREKWIIWRDGDKDEAGEAMIIGFTKRDEYPWKVKTSIGGIDAAGLLKCYVFNDGTPCGRRVDD